MPGVFAEKEEIMVHNGTLCVDVGDTHKRSGVIHPTWLCGLGPPLDPQCPGQCQAQSGLWKNIF